MASELYSNLYADKVGIVVLRYRFTAARNEHPAPFEWTKSVVHPGGLKKRYADL